MIPHSRSSLVTALFAAHAKNRIQRAFRRLSLTRESRMPEFTPGVPVIAVFNHSSWWDALMCLYLGSFVFRREYYGVFDEKELLRYSIFRKVGSFSVNRPPSTAEMKRFLEYCEALLKGTSRLLWIFPQGDIVSADSLPLQFKGGFASIASRLEEFDLLRFVVRYDFWLDSKPEIVMDILPLERHRAQSGSVWRDELVLKTEETMTARLRAVREIVRERRRGAIRPLWTREEGTHPIYDLWRRVAAGFKGSEFKISHGQE